MPRSSSSDLHGNAPDRCAAALLLIDWINDLEFEGGDRLLPQALAAAKATAALRQRAKQAGVPMIYCNDNFGRWRSDFREVVRHCLDDDVAGRPIAQLLAPGREDYFVLKPKHSAFFATVLETLLEHLGAKRLILGGFAGDACVLMTAADAHLHDYEIHVPRDCIASQSRKENTQALRYMARVLDADTTASTALNLSRLAGPRRRVRKNPRSGG